MSAYMCSSHVGRGLTGCGLIIRRVCVLVPDSIARTIAPENRIGLVFIWSFVQPVEVGERSVCRFKCVLKWKVAVFGS